MNKVRYYIKPTKVTPLVKLDSAGAFLFIAGRSSPSNAIGFYQPILERIRRLAKSEIPTFTATFKFEYFNTSSSKCLFDIFKELRLIAKNGSILIINWVHDEGDEDMLEVGEDYADLLNLDINFIGTPMGLSSI